MKPTTIGEVTVAAIMEYSGPYRDPLEMYPDATPEMVERHRPWMEPECLDPATGKMILAFQSYLLRTPHHTVLIDTCVGEDKERPLRPDWHRMKWPWMDNLRAAGVAPEDIDFVLCTHLHVDHVGWNTRLEDGRWVPTFPNARYLFARTEYAFWETRHKDDPYYTDVFRDSVLPVVEAGRVDFVDGDHEIESGLHLEPSPGHTPGHVCVNLESGGQRAVFSGDMMHHPLQVPEHQLSSMFCADPDQSRKTRTAFVERHADTGTLIVPAHFPGRTAGRIVGRDGGLMFEFSDG